MNDELYHKLVIGILALIVVMIIFAIWFGLSVTWAKLFFTLLFFLLLLGIMVAISAK
jgi:hypothetical protein